MQSEAFFLTVQNSQRFCLLHPAHTAPARGLVVYVHPFADEMNKSRRMAALQARALACAGFTVLQLDLLGCGDSSGDFGDATWQAWVADVVIACDWLRAYGCALRPGQEPPPLWLWGLRAGCLLATQAAAQLTQPCDFLFWQPPVDGQRLVQQLLRLKAAANLSGGQATTALQDLRQRFAQGESVEIGGYMLAAALANGLASATLAPPNGGGRLGGTGLRQVVWLEISARADASLGPASTQALQQWQQAGYQVRSQAAHGPAFWGTPETVDAPALIAATTAAMTAALTAHAL